jgi:hypothetical protein
MTDDDPVTLRFRQGIVTPVLLGVLASAIALLGIIVANVVTLPVATLLWFATWKSWQYRSHEYFAKISRSSVTWWERGIQQTILFAELDRVEDSDTLDFILKNGRRVSSNAGFPDTHMLFRAVREKFSGRMVRGNTDVPPPRVAGP